jgi:hypothetical protein
MFTQEQKAKKTTQAEGVLSDAQGRVDRYKRLLATAEGDVTTAKATLEWVRAMPVNGSSPAPTDQADDTA